METFIGGKYTYKFEDKKDEIINKIQRKIKGYEIAGDKKSRKLEDALVKIQNGLEIPEKINKKYSAIKEAFNNYGSVVYKIRNTIRGRIGWIVPRDTKSSEYDSLAESLIKNYHLLKEEIQTLRTNKAIALKKYKSFNRGAKKTPKISQAILDKAGGYNLQIIKLKGIINEAKKIANYTLNNELEKKLKEKLGDDWLKIFNKAEFPVRKKEKIYKNFFEAEYLVPSDNYRKLNKNAYKKLLKMNKEGNLMEKLGFKQEED